MEFPHSNRLKRPRASLAQLSQLSQTPPSEKTKPRPSKIRPPRRSLANFKSPLSTKQQERPTPLRFSEPIIKPQIFFLDEVADLEEKIHEKQRNVAKLELILKECETDTAFYKTLITRMLEAADGVVPELVKLLQEKVN